VIEIGAIVGLVCEEEDGMEMGPPGAEAEESCEVTAGGLLSLLLIVLLVLLWFRLLLIMLLRFRLIFESQSALSCSNTGIPRCAKSQALRGARV